MVWVSKIKEWLEEDKLILLEGWARDGLSLEQIAKNIGINECTIYDWKKKEVKISEALKKGKEVVDFEVENALYKSAMEGNVTAQIYWLKCRKKEKWGEKEVPNNNEVNERITNIANLLNNPQPNRSDDDVQ